MDIFTTALTRVVPVPIKPASLKVKALLKEAGTSKLKEDPDHLENHDYYFVDKKITDNKEEQGEQHSSSEHATSSSEHNVANTPEDKQQNTEDKQQNTEEDADTSQDGIKHLDLYV